MASLHRALGTLSLGFVATLSAQEPVTEAIVPVEFGTIDWQRDFDAARRTATQQDRDLLMLFQEVPG